MALQMLNPTLPVKPRKRRRRTRAASVDAGHARQPLVFIQEEEPNWGRAVHVPRAMWWRSLRPRSYDGFDRRSIWEGGVGLFLCHV
ncbi:hypothetical protein NL676_033314 [Syzygium grande]|nr:hypothetical protein NL676_033314 [Syzygium grande]